MMSTEAKSNAAVEHTCATASTVAVSTGTAFRKAQKPTRQMSKRDTRERILEAAENVFLEKGFEKATVREICRRAKANVAAINYHFSDKRDLYYRVLESWLDQCFERYPVGLGEEDGMNATDRLFHYVRSTLARLLLDVEGEDPAVNLRQARLFMRELSREHPNNEVLQKGHVDDITHLATIVAEITGLESGDPLVHQACMSIKGQCVHYFLVRMAGLDVLHTVNSEQDLDPIARHITNFSLGGMARLKELA